MAVCEKTSVFHKFRNLKVVICIINGNRGCIFFWVYILLQILMGLNGTKCNKNEPKRAKNSFKKPYFYSLSPVQLHSMQQKTKA